MRGHMGASPSPSAASQSSTATPSATCCSCAAPCRAGQRHRRRQEEATDACRPRRRPIVGGGARPSSPTDVFGARAATSPSSTRSVRPSWPRAARAPTSTKTRGQVAGGGAKPWRQKGTGRARQGTTRAPQWAGGGVVFGPQPRTYGGKVNRKACLQGAPIALSVHAARGSLGVFDGAFDAPRRRTAAELWPAWRRGRPLVVVDRRGRGRARPARSATCEAAPRRRRPSARSRSPDASCWAARAIVRRAKAALEELAEAGARHERRSPRRHPRAGHVREELPARREHNVHVPRHADAHKTQIRQAVEDIFERHA